MTVKDSYFTISKPISNEIKVQKSKFVVRAFPLPSQLKFQEILDNVRKLDYDASHHPFAYRLGLGGNNFRYSDDGEPSGSAGKPILDVIDKFELTNILVIVSRYFGGIKLGVGGLRRAFFEAAEECLRLADIERKYLMEELNLESDYSYMNVIMNVLEKEGAKILKNDSDERVKLTCSVRISALEKIKNELVNSTAGNLTIK